MALTDADSDGGEENAVVNLKMAITFQSSFNYFPGFVVPLQAAIRTTGMWREHVLLWLLPRKGLLFQTVCKSRLIESNKEENHCPLTMSFYCYFFSPAHAENNLYSFCQVQLPHTPLWKYKITDCSQLMCTICQHSSFLSISAKKTSTGPL